MKDISLLEKILSKFLSHEQISALTEEISKGVSLVNSIIDKNEKVKATKELVVETFKSVDKMQGICLVTADHGNADEMYELDKKTGCAKINKEGKIAVKTSHTLNRVPFYIYDNFHADKYQTVECRDGEYGLANVAATVVTLLGEEAPSVWKQSIIELK